MTEKLELVKRSDLIRNVCRGKSVLHLGCTNYPYTDDAIRDGALLHFELEKIAGEVYGFDFDRSGLDILAGHGAKNLYQADLEKLEDIPLEKKFDVIIAGEMIEHLNNPGLFLEGIKRFMGPDSILVITTINAYCGMRFFIYGLRGKGGFSEPVHPDHVAYYSYSTLNVLLKRFGLNVEKFMFYDLGDEHRPHNRWYLNLINDISVKISPQLADGVIAVCRVEHR
jgi:SAM-dependent methyltransferase